MERPRMRLSGPTIDSPAPLQLAEFYARLLGWPIEESQGPRPDAPAEDGWAKLRAPDGSKLEIQFEPNHRPPVWPSTPDGQLMMLHLDIGVADLDAGVEWALAAGARLAEHQPQPGVRVLLDPDGHPFCLFTDPAA